MVRGARAARPRGGPPPFRHALLPLRHDARAVAVRAVVRRGRGAQGPRDRGRHERRGDVPSRALDPDLSHLDGQPQGLVHQPPAVVGSPHPGVLLRRVRLDRRAHGGRGHVSQMRRQAAPGRGRARHLVLQPAVDVRHAGLADPSGADGGAPSHDRARDRARHHRAVGGAHDHGVDVFLQGDPVQGRGHLRNDPGQGRHAHVQVQGQRRRPDGPHRHVRRRRDALQPADAGDQQPGRALRRRHRQEDAQAPRQPPHRAGARVRHQDLEREPLRAGQPRGLRAGRAGGANPGGCVDLQPSGEAVPSGNRRDRDVSVRRGSPRAQHVFLERVLRLVHRVHQSGSARGCRSHVASAVPTQPGVRAGYRIAASASGDAVRH